MQRLSFSWFGWEDNELSEIRCPYRYQDVPAAKMARNQKKLQQVQQKEKQNKWKFGRDKFEKPFRFPQHSKTLPSVLGRYTN